MQIIAFEGCKAIANIFFACVSVSRPPPNLLRQEIEGTRIYLTILNRALTESKVHTEHNPLSNGSLIHSEKVKGSEDVPRGEQWDVRDAAEERMVSFCAQILKEAAVSQPTIGDVLESEAFFAATLRSPVVVKVNV